MKNNILNDEYYKSLYTLTEFQIKEKAYNYQVVIHSDVVDVKKYLNNVIVESLEENIILFYKETIQVLDMLNRNYKNFDKKILKISDDTDNYFIKVELDKNESTNQYSLTRCFQSNEKGTWVEMGKLTFENISIVKTFYQTIKDEIENADVDIV